MNANTLMIGLYLYKAFSPNLQTLRNLIDRWHSLSQKASKILFLLHNSFLKYLGSHIGRIRVVSSKGDDKSLS